MDHFGIHILKNECSLVLNKVQVKIQFCDDYILKNIYFFVTKESPLVNGASSEESDEVRGLERKTECSDHHQVVWKRWTAPGVYGH